MYDVHNNTRYVRITVHVYCIRGVLCFVHRVAVKDGTPSVIILLKGELSAFTRLFISEYHCKD